MTYFGIVRVEKKPIAHRRSPSVSNMIKVLFMGAVMSQEKAILSKYYTAVW